MDITMDSVFYWLSLMGYNPVKIGNGSVVKIFVSELSFLVNCESNYIRIRLAMDGCLRSQEDILAAASFVMNNKKLVKIYTEQQDLDSYIIFSIEQFVPNWDYCRDNFNLYIRILSLSVTDFVNYISNNMKF